MRVFRHFALFLAVLLPALCLHLPARADDQADARTYATTLGNEAVSILSDNGMDKAAKRQKLEALFAQNVDIDWIGKFVLGRFWRDATDAQKAQYLTNYKTFLITHYTSRLSEFTDAKFQVAKAQADANGGFSVTVHIQRPNAADTIVDYTLKRKDGQFKVYDILVEGVSMLTTQRSEFASVVSQKGLDYLITQLADRSKNDGQGTPAQ